MKHRIEIAQERWEYDLTTNSMKLMREITSAFSNVDFCNYLINFPAVKASDENLHL